MVRSLTSLKWLSLLSALFIPCSIQAQENHRIVIAGAASIAPLAEKFSTQFRKKYPQVEIELLGGGSNYAISALRREEIDVGLVARRLSAEEKAGLHVEIFGHDAMFILTYPGNKAGSLTLVELRRIYLGRITNWSEVGGEEKGIIPLTRERSSAIGAIFYEQLFGKNFTGEQHAFTIRASKEKVLRTVKRVEGSIGYGILQTNQAERQGIKILGIDGKLPTDENIRAGLYPLTRPQMVIAGKNPSALAREWMNGFARFAAQATAAQRYP